MNRTVRTLGILGIASCISSTNLSPAAVPVEGHELNPQIKPGTPEVVISPGKKGGPAAPPADPVCPIGSSAVGPIDHSEFSQACTEKGKAGTQQCYRKTVHCLSGPGEPDYVSTQRCGRCIPSPTQPGQTQSPSGR